MMKRAVPETQSQPTGRRWRADPYLPSPPEGEQEEAS